MITTSTPLRISFFGGGTDYPAWYREHGGSVLATTINKYCYITTRWLPPFFEYHSRISYLKVENVSRNSDIQHPSVRACLEFMGVEEGVEVHHIADLPARSGLGTSSAFTGFHPILQHVDRRYPAPVCGRHATNGLARIRCRLYGHCQRVV